MLRKRPLSPLCPQVLYLFAELPKPGEEDANARCAGRAYEQLADGQHARPARGITTALAALQDETGLASETRQIKSLNHRVKQDHRLIQRILQSLLGFSALASARRTVRV
jgi:hypothetical protein